MIIYRRESIQEAIIETPRNDMKFEGINVIDIVEMNSFDKLEAYRDRFPFLALRKFICKQRLNVSIFWMNIISHPIFDNFSLFVIVVNSIILAFYDPLNPTQFDTGVFAYFDTAFLTLYTIEMMLKIFAYGFVLNKGSYLRDSWNILDFTIVMSSYLQMMISSGTNLNVLRSFRVLRPLRTISGIEGLRVIVTVLMKSISLLLDILIILMFFFIIFAIAGLNLWFGALKYRWINKTTGMVHPDHDIWGSNECPVGYFWGKTNEDPNYGVTSFDNIFYSFLLVIQSVTLEGWMYNMTAIQKASNYLSLFFFIPLIFVGAYFLLNLFLVVLKSKFTEEQILMKERKRNQNKSDSIVSEELVIKEQNINKVYNNLKKVNDDLHTSKIGRVDSDDSYAQRRHQHNLDTLKQSQNDLSRSKIFTPHSSDMSLVFQANVMNASFSNKKGSRNIEEEKYDNSMYLTNNQEVSREDIWFTNNNDYHSDGADEMYIRDKIYSKKKFKAGYEMIKETVHEDEINEDLYNHFKSRSEDIKLDTEHHDNHSEDYEADWESDNEYEEFIPKNIPKRNKSKNNNLQQSKKNITNIKMLILNKQELIKKNSFAKYNKKNENETSKRLYSHDQFKIKRKYSNFINQNASISRNNETPIENLKLDALNNTQSRNVLSALKPSENNSHISFGICSAVNSEGSFPK